MVGRKENPFYMKVKSILDLMNMKYKQHINTQSIECDIFICFDYGLASELRDKVDLRKNKILLLELNGGRYKNIITVENFKQTPLVLYKTLYDLYHDKCVYLEYVNIDITILVVDDYDINRELIAQILKKHNIQADFAVNGEDAVKMTEKNSYDIIFMDINMPIMNGVEATKMIRKNDSTTPIIALSANVFQSDIDLYTEVGMNGYLAKPLDSTLFLDYIKENKREKTSQTTSTNTSQSNEYSENIDDSEDIESIDTSFVTEAVKLLGLPEQVIKNLMIKFINDAKEGLDVLSEEPFNYEAIRSCSHKFKGSSKTLRLLEIAAIFEKVEELATLEKKIDYSKKKEELLASLKRYETELKK